MKVNLKFQPEISAKPEQLDEGGEAELVHLLDDEGPGVLQDQGVGQGREEPSGQPLRFVRRVTPFHQGGNLKSNFKFQIFRQLIVLGF